MPRRRSMSAPLMVSIDTLMDNLPPIREVAGPSSTQMSTASEHRSSGSVTATQTGEEARDWGFIFDQVVNTDPHDKDPTFTARDLAAMGLPISARETSAMDIAATSQDLLEGLEGLRRQSGAVLSPSTSTRMSLTVPSTTAATAPTPRTPREFQDAMQRLAQLQDLRQSFRKVSLQETTDQRGEAAAAVEDEDEDEDEDDDETSATPTSTHNIKEERRKNHVLNEQRRRRNMKEAYDTLARIVPSLQHRSTPKTQLEILNKTLDYIGYLRRQCERVHLENIQVKEAYLKLATEKK